jgi:dihydroflavonol-4-reductase
LVRVLVTGVSGFVGCHVTAALIATGHEVRALVRSRARFERALEPLGVSVEDVAVVIGDVTDSDNVNAAVDGCEAVVHTASVYSLDPRRATEMMATNVGGTDNVLGAAVEAGCDPIIYVSTAQTFWPTVDSVGDDPPLAPEQGFPYSDSKKRAEAIARRWQAREAPVTTTYPGAILGPNDPGPGEQIPFLRTFLVPTAPFRVKGGFPMCDIDWITQIHLESLQPKQGPRRVTCSGTYMEWHEMFSLARELTGRRLPTPLPTRAWVLNAMGNSMDALQKIVPTRLPFGREGSWIVQNAVPSPDEVAIDLAGPPPPLEETLAKAVRWAVNAGHLKRRHAGTLAQT